MPLEDVERVLGYRFRSSGLLEEAITHPSLNSPYNNQRLEFLGDKALGIMVAELLFKLFPAEKEGAIAKRHAALVCRDFLAEFARAKGLGAYLQMSYGEENIGGRENPANLEDMVEALFGAVYLDGGIDAVEQVFQDYWKERAGLVKAPPKDPKTTLQEYAQARGLPLPHYELVETEGPVHAPLFTVAVHVEGQACVATATTKRAAEREAARLMLEHLQQETD